MFIIRLSEQEKSTLKRLAKKNDMYASEYIRLKLFINNPDLADSEHIYETPPKDRHNFFAIELALNTLAILMKLLEDKYPGDNFKEVFRSCKALAQAKLIETGYHKIKVGDE